ncbi:hypothetical protein [Arthrobacter sp. NPDC057013]|uniref:hypothetical protein n=1 Tax=Arthrobacter sp. NPDC057013 TaxID=3345999 RepID=UPI00362C4314
MCPRAEFDGWTAGNSVLRRYLRGLRGIAVFVAPDGFPGDVEQLEFFFSGEFAARQHLQGGQSEGFGPLVLIKRAVEGPLGAPPPFGAAVRLRLLPEGVGIGLAPLFQGGLVRFRALLQRPPVDVEGEDSGDENGQRSDAGEDHPPFGRARVEEDVYRRRGVGVAAVVPP